MSKRSMMQLRDVLCRTLDDIAAKGDIKAGDLQTVHMLTDTIKNIDKIEMLEGGESYGAGPYTGYDHDDSYGRHYVRGHYSNTDRRYSMDAGKERLMAQIEDMMRDADEGDRQALKRAMDALRR